MSLKETIRKIARKAVGMQEFETRLNSLSYYFSSWHDISQFPMAQGPLRDLQLADARLIAIVDKVLEKHGIRFYLNDSAARFEGNTAHMKSGAEVPFDVLVGESFGNFAAAGRMINADTGAYGALRVMVNLNQLGEAAGAAAALCLERGETMQTLNGRCVTAALRKGGSAL